MQGMDGGTAGPDDTIIEETFRNLGATIMGRNMFGPIRGPWGKDAWRGWWGDNPPYHTPVFVRVTRASRWRWRRHDVHFVTDGINQRSKGKENAGRKDASFAGGEQTNSI
jgi:dihydrofolate reductase